MFAALTAGTMLAQGPLYDHVVVDLPYATQVQGKTLPAGEYTIREHESKTDSNILHIFGNNGIDLKATVNTIDTVDKSTPNDTKVVLDHVGNQYYFDKIWIQGKNYGYEFILPEDVRSRLKEERASVDLPARWEAGDQNSTNSDSSDSSNAQANLKNNNSASADRVGDTSQNYMTDRLVRQVRHELVMLPYYSVFDHFAYKIDGHTVTLMGQVTRPTLKSSAENVVKDIEGVEQVNNQIEVLPVSPHDDQIRIAEYRAIYSQPSMQKYATQAVPPIHIIVNNGKVTLYGVVGNEGDKNIANIQANSVPGVFSVTNNLRVDKG